MIRYFIGIFLMLPGLLFGYTHAGGSVTVTTGYQDKDTFTCSVADTGIGIAPERFNNIFRKFNRGEEAAHMNTSGMGLGLYLVKNILEREGGTVSFVSEVGKGTTFTITLPTVRTP